MKFIICKRHLLFLIAWSPWIFAACSPNRTAAESTAHDEGTKDQSEGEAKSASAHTDEHNGHHHEEAEVSDLDRPLSDLFGATCEHNMKTYECDECRYEVGVVKAVSAVFEGGLLKTEKAAIRPVSVPLHLTGEVEFDDRRVAQVSTLAEGIIKKVHVTLGDKVKARQALINVESVAVGESEASYLEAKGLLRLAAQNKERVFSLHQEGIASEKETLAAAQELDAAQIRFDASFGRLTRLGMSSTNAKSLSQSRAKGRLILRAPVEGTVLAMHAVAGEIAHTETSLITIGNNESMWVWADLYEENIAMLSAAQAQGALSAAVTVKAFPREQFDGIVDFISPSMSESSRTVKVRIAVPNPGGRLLAGMFAKVEIAVLADEKAVSVPQKAVVEDDGRAFVFIHHEGDYYVRRPVTLGRTFASYVEIKAGLTSEEVVVSNGAFLMKSDVLRSKMGAGCAD